MGIPLGYEVERIHCITKQPVQLQSNDMIRMVILSKLRVEYHRVVFPKVFRPTPLHPE